MNHATTTQTAKIYVISGENLANKNIKILNKIWTMNHKMSKTRQISNTSFKKGDIFASFDQISSITALIAYTLCWSAESVWPGSAEWQWSDSGAVHAVTWFYF